jgi:hypothetical protein
MVTNNSANYQPTQYAVQIGGANGALANVALGTASQVLTSNGAGVAPTFQTVSAVNSPSFIAYQSSAVSNATGDGTTYSLICGSTLTNVGAAYATGTGLFTAPTSGAYVFNANVYLNLLGAAHTLCQCYFVNVTTGVSIGTFAFCNPFACSNSSQFVVQGNVILQLAASDQVKVTVQVANGAKTVQIFGAATVLQTAFSGFKIG